MNRLQTLIFRRGVSRILDGISLLIGLVILLPAAELFFVFKFCLELDNMATQVSGAHCSNTMISFSWDTRI